MTLNKIPRGEIIRDVVDVEALLWAVDGERDGRWRGVLVVLGLVEKCDSPDDEPLAAPDCANAGETFN